jgi:regulator of sigma E protease
LFSVVSVLGLPEIVDDAETGLPNTRVQISSVLPNSPAQAVGLKPGDVLEQLVDPAGAISISRVQQVQDLIDRSRGKNITLVVKRGEQVLSFAVSPRLSPPSGQGPLGVTLARTALRTYPWWQAPWLGLKSTVQVTVLVVSAYKDSLVKLWQGSPTGLSLMGPVGIIGLLSQGLNMGVSYFLQMIGVLSISAAVVNLLPIPAFDGGKLAFIFLEAIRRKPVSRQLEERVSTVFFGLLIILMVVVTFKDIRSFF